MVTEDTGFKHISVASDSEDEIVIQAGAVTPSVQAPEPESVQDGEFATEAMVHEKDALAGLSEDERKEYEQHLRQREARNQALRMETTEEDLHVKMPFAGMQRTIVIALALLAVAAIVYWVSRHSFV